jgi:hypothetical protein
MDGWMDRYMNKGRRKINAVKQAYKFYLSSKEE